MINDDVDDADDDNQWYGFAQSDSCVKQTSETDGRQKQVLAADLWWGFAPRIKDKNTWRPSQSQWAAEDGRHMFLSSPSLSFILPQLFVSTHNEMISYLTSHFIHILSLTRIFPEIWCYILSMIAKLSSFSLWSKHVLVIPQIPITHLFNHLYLPFLMFSLSYFADHE